MSSSIFKRNIQREVLKSVYLQAEKEILISLPPEYKPDQLYPILLLHDGRDYFQMGRLITQTNQLLAQNEIHPVIMVALPIQKEQRNQEYSPSGKTHMQHLEFVAQEVIPMIKEKYQPTANPDQFIVAGSSLGATAALHFALTYPELCSRVLAQSGAFLETTIEQIHLSRDLSHLEIYQSVGLSETAVPTHFGHLDLVTRNREVYEALTQKEAQVMYIEREGDHTWGLWQIDLPHALRAFFGT
ncbi:Enterochelin esterase [Seinonella peptonophila]|uniref:Enterochelin esterase n=1 Tax=Seinonella peptonophila TaxID=112248 RepID=A0A1M5AKP7_9BACL|nr:alpha/beta hydrolase-fold protein [Seinonella peptonophila]SHF30726.1 Enterochelin esterase [Seinonella peptonophila]